MTLSGRGRAQTENNNKRTGWPAAMVMDTVTEKGRREKKKKKKKKKRDVEGEWDGAM
jgi:hypothetical protein